MSKQVWREFGTIGLSVLLLTSLSIAQPVGTYDQSQNGPVSLFGIRIGTRLPDSRDYVFVQEDESTLRYILRNTTSPEYLIQAVNISKQSRVVTIDNRQASFRWINGGLPTARVFGNLNFIFFIIVFFRHLTSLGIKPPPLGKWPVLGL